MGSVYVQSKNNGTNESIYKAETESQKQKTNLRLPQQGINWEIEININTLLSITQIANEGLLYSTGNSTQFFVMAYMGKESKRKERVDISICI